MSQENLLNANGGGSSNGSTNSSNEASKQQQQQQQQQQQYQQQPVQNYPTIAQTTNSSSINIKLVETNDQPQLLQQQSQQQQQPVVEDTNHVSATNTTANTTTQPTTIVTTVNENEISNTAVVGATKEEEKEKAVEEEEAAEDEDEDDDDEEAENAVVEESGDGRWSKRKEAVSQRDIPGIDCAYLAMDTEYGVEVVWNEIKLSRGKKFKNENLHSDEKAIDSVFKNLINLNHPNIVRFHDYWIDKRENDPRIIFITEYMSSGSLKQFLRKAKKTNQPIKKATWKRWCIQLLCALNYLHTCEPPVGHGNLSCDTIFIQHNGLIKIGCIAPDKVNTHVKTCRRDDMKWSRNLHFIAPELHTGDVANMKTLKTSQMTNNNTAVDIYAFGMVALEIFNLEFGGNGDTHPVTSELIKQAIEALDEKQRDFVTRCLETDPQKRPTIKELLFHPLLFEVPSLKLIASHQLIKTQNESRETTFNDSKFTRPPECVVASVPSHPITRDYLFSKVPTFDVNKYLEDVKNGIYPLIAYGLISGPNSATMMNASNSSSNVAALQAAVQSPSSAGGQQKRLNSTSSLRQLQQSAAQIVTGVETSKQQTITNTSPVQVTNTNTTPYIVDNIVPSAIVNLPLSGQVSTTISAASSQTTSPTQSLSQINLHPVPINLPTQQQQQQQQQQSTTPTQQPATPQQTSRTQSPIHITTNGATTSNTILNSDYTSTLNQQQQQLPVQQQQQLIMMNGDYINNNNNNTTSNNNNVNYVMDSNMSTATTTAMVIDPSILVTSNQLEKRHAQNIDINLTLDEKLMNYMLTLTITFEDRTARLIQSLLHKTDTVFNLADELVSHGLVNELDKDQLCYLLSQALNRVEQSNTILSK